MYLYNFYLLFSIVLSVCNSEILKTLNGDWFVRDENGKYSDIKATVPGGIYSDLMRNGIIGDIFYGYGDNSTKWIPRTNWTYYTNFTVEKGFMDYENFNIVFEGLDTFSTIFVNDVEIGKSNNMFVEYAFNLTNIIKPGLNTIEVRFQSPIEVSANLYDIQKKLYRIPWECPPDEYHGECHINMIRKMQASFSWDWGPSFPSVGIWKSVFLESYNASAIRYVVADVVEKDDSWALNIDTYFAANRREELVGKILYEIVLEDHYQLARVYDIMQKPDENGEIIQSITFDVPKSHVLSWWPNRYGSPQLYNLTVTFCDSNEIEKSSKMIRVGFRTVELVQDKIESGLTFYLKVNGVPMFIKGANTIPINILPEWGQNQSTIKHLLTSAANAHMNMIRVWGGGVYESDYFYDLADELGLLVWQDFMFACSLYPANEEYLSNVIQEVRHNVKRLRSHPSIVVYSGNNENEGVLANNWYGTQDNYTLYKKDYVKLYITTIQSEFDKITHNRSIFVSSSPTNGKESNSEGFVAKNPGSNFFGDVHFYNYILDPSNANFYPIPRFASEYGYQSLPSVDTFLTATNDSADLQPFSDFMNYRQHHPLGNAEMKLLMYFNLKLPDDNITNYHKAYIYYSQITQAESIKTETEHYRRHRSNLDSQGQGFTMGALYWQLNDVWVAPTWSSIVDSTCSAHPRRSFCKFASYCFKWNFEKQTKTTLLKDIDYTGRYKMLHYFAKNFFSPLLISGYLNIERELQLYVVSDLTYPVEDVDIHIKVYKWDSFQPVNDSSFRVNLNASESALLKTLRADDYLSSMGCGSLQDARYKCFFYFTMNIENRNELGYNYVFPATPASSEIPLAKVKIISVQKYSSENDIFEITINSDNIALYVWLDSHEILGNFSENGFLQIEANKLVLFQTNTKNVTIESLIKSLTVTNLRDPLYFVE